MTPDSKPLIPVSPEGLDELAQSLLKDDSPQPKAKSSRRPTLSSTEKSEKYLILDGDTHGKYSYPDLLVATQTTYKDNDWNDTHKKLENNGELMLTPRQFVDFLNMLKSGKAFYASGKQADSRALTKILNDIVEVRSPWRSEWLDSKFVNQGNFLRKKLGMTYHKINSDGTLEEVTEPLKDCLMKDKTPGINLDYWLKGANSQGLPAPDTKDGDMYFWYPRSDRVARFGADSGGAFLFCNGDSQDSDSGLGVRPAKIKK